MTTLQDNLSRISQGSEPQPGRPLPAQTNISQAEKWGSLLVGSGLVLTGLRRMSLGGLITAGVGAVLIQRGVSGHCGVYESLGINTADGPARPEEYFSRGIHISQSCTIDKDATELYQFWHNFENLPRIMSHLEAVQRVDEKRSHWTVRAPAGTTVGWDAEIINDEPGKLIAWRSLAGADVDNAGSVRFVPAEGGETEVRVVIDYIPPAGRVGAFVARLFGENPQQQLEEDLGRFKEMMESGEMAEAQGQSSGA